MTELFVAPSDPTPGDFKRQGQDGPPYVKSLTKTRKPQGNKAELLEQAKARDLFVPPKTTVPELRELLGPEPAWELYGRPSGFGRLIEDEWNLHKWRERNTVLGIAMDPDLLMIMQDVGDDLSEREALDRICGRAHDTEHADTMMAADRGTFIHSLTEWADDGATGTPPWCDPRFDLTDKHIDLIAHGWRKLIADNHLDILATEAKVVNDDLRLAGTLDRIVRLGTDLVFDGVTIPQGTIVVLDIKTSTLHADGDGVPSYWAAFPLQVYAYATSVPYDTDINLRGEWGFDVDTGHALIAHFDIDTLRDTGQAVWQLIYIDLNTAQEGVTATLAAEQYHRKVKFKMPATTTTIGEPPCTPTDTTSTTTRDTGSTAATAPTPIAPSPTSGSTTNPDPTPTPPNNASQTSSPAKDDDSPDSDTRRNNLLDRYRALSDPDQEAFRKLNIDRDDLDAIEAALVDLEVDPFDRIATIPEPDTNHNNDDQPVDDGDPIGNTVIDGLLADIANSDHKDAVNRWAHQAVEAGLTIDVRTHRRYRYWLILYLAHQLAETFRGDDETVIVWFDQPDPPGVILAGLSIDEALDALARLAAISDMVVDMIPEQQTLLG